VIRGGSLGSLSHLDSFDIESASVCLVDFVSQGIFFLSLIRRYAAFSLWDSEFVPIFIFLDLVLVSLCGVFF
jgi:hypothetical protein